MGAPIGNQNARKGGGGGSSNSKVFRSANSGKTTIASNRQIAAARKSNNPTAYGNMVSKSDLKYLPPRLKREAISNSRKLKR